MCERKRVRKREWKRSKIGGKSVKVVVLFLYTFDAARTQLVTNIKGRMVIGVRE